MSEPFIGEVQIFGFPFAPYGWALAAGQLVPIRQQSALFSLYGIQFGGDGVNTFGLPNLASRQACGAGQSPGNSRRPMGQAFGAPTVSEFEPSDPSVLTATPTPASAIGIVGNSGFNAFAAVGASGTMMNPNAIGLSGSGAPHENLQPYLGLTYAVALTGNYPYFD